TRIALQRLELAEAQVPYPLENARLEREAREQIEQELRARKQLAPGASDERRSGQQAGGGN
ncbi:MAG TPA: hypothetical protein VEZ40_07735, partial [Pyrinomonadaceae bacterium]|nr:hypothetical protein [Pyrinomonadaceae bacterium]